MSTWLSDFTHYKYKQPFTKAEADAAVKWARHGRARHLMMFSETKSPKAYTPTKGMREMDN